MAGVQPDIAGNFFKGAAAREAINTWGEARQDRQLKREGARRALGVEMGGVIPENINALYDPYEWSLKNVLGNWKQNFRENSPFGYEARQERKGNRALRRQGIPTADEAMATGVDRMQTYADGGRVGVGRLDQLAAEQARIQQGMDAAARKPGLLSRAGSAVRSGVNKVGRLAAPAALGVTAYDTATTPTEDYRTRFGMELDSGEDASLLGDIGVRALGAASDLGSALTFGYADNFYRDKQQAEPSNPEAAVAIPETVPAEEPAATSPPGGAGAATPQQATASPFVGPPEPDQEASMLGSVDIMPDDMPSMGTRDWIAYREEMVPALMMQGMSAQEAHQQVSTMQHQGFMRYAQQAAMMLQAQNPQGAARALKAAYQYFPNGSDVKFGIQTGKDGQPALVALALDEETGEPKGTPQVISNEYLASMVTNFQDPSKYLAWTKDWRDEAFRDRTYNEITKPEAQNMMNYRNRALDIQEMNAGANIARALTSGASGGASEADLDRAGEIFREYAFSLPEDQYNSAVADMEQARRKFTWDEVSNGKIAEQFAAAYAAGPDAVAELKQLYGLQ